MFHTKASDIILNVRSSVLPDEGVKDVGTIRETTGTKSSESKQLWSLGAVPFLVGMSSAAPSYCTIAAGKRFSDVPQNPPPCDVPRVTLNQ